MLMLSANPRGLTTTDRTYGHGCQLPDVTT